MNETEVKIRLKEPEKAREMILGLGARIKAKDTQFNSFYDTPGFDLTNSGVVLRVRLEGEKKILCFKGKKEVVNGIKSREELECFIEGNVEGIIEGLGYELKIGYEKERETFLVEKAEIMLDRLPLMGWFLEIEGERDRIEELLAELGLEREDRLPEGYIKLYKRFFKEKGVAAPKRILFKESSGKADII